MGSLSKKLQILKTEFEKANEIAEKFIKNDSLAIQFFDMSLDMLAITGKDGYFKLVNKAWANVLGYTEEEIIGKIWLDFVHPEDIEETKKFSTYVREGNVGINFENRYKGKDNQYIKLSWTSKQNSDGTIFSTVKVIT